jgi:hypothetical protein
MHDVKIGLHAEINTQYGVVLPVPDVALVAQEAHDALAPLDVGRANDASLDGFACA